MNRAGLLLLLVFFACSLPALAQDGAPADEGAERITLSVTERVVLGAPFLVRLTSLDPVEEAVFQWQGRQVLPAVSVWNEKHVALAMLGTDIQTNTAGEAELVLVAVVDGERLSFTRTVNVEARQSPEEPEREVPEPNRAELERMNREAREAAQAMFLSSPERRWFLPFDRPVEAAVSGVYGAERSVNGRQTFRRGVDFAAGPGTPVHAAGTGTVVLVADHLMAGKSVYMDHGNGVVSMYFHLLRADVTVGQSLARGEILGMSGSSGRPDGPKLHFAVSVQGRLVDPEPLFNNNAEDFLP